VHSAMSSDLEKLSIEMHRRGSIDHDASVGIVGYTIRLVCDMPELQYSSADPTAVLWLALYYCVGAVQGILEVGGRQWA
jgi:hypothetical protein